MCRASFQMFYCYSHSSRGSLSRPPLGHTALTLTIVHVQMYYQFVVLEFTILQVGVDESPWPVTLDKLDGYRL